MHVFQEVLETLTRDGLVDINEVSIDNNGGELSRLRQERTLRVRRSVHRILGILHPSHARHGIKLGSAMLGFSRLLPASPGFTWLHPASPGLRGLAGACGGLSGFRTAGP